MIHLPPSYKPDPVEAEFTLMMMEIRGANPQMVAFHRRLMTKTLHPPKHDPSSPKTTVIRIELKHEPWNGLNEVGDFVDELQDLANELGSRNPWACPAIWKENEKLSKHWTVEFFCGFADLTQATHWFQHPDLRAKLIHHRSLEVALYSIAEDQVLRGDYQVGFLLREADLVRNLTAKEFIDAQLQG